MPTINEIALFTEFSRPALTLRARRFGLEGPDYKCKDLMGMHPLDAKQEQRMSLEEARTQESIENTELKRIQRQKLEGELVPISEMLPMQSRLLEGISAIIKSSGLEEERKSDIFDAINRHLDQWEQE
jgi:hypothetical protein